MSTFVYPFYNIQANVGEITNTGVEFSVNAIPVKTKDFTWNTTLNLSHNKNTVDKLPTTFTRPEPSPRATRVWLVYRRTATPSV